MNARGSLLVYQSFSRLFPRLARLPVRSVTACKPFDLHQHGGPCWFPTSTRSFSIGSRLLSSVEHSENSDKQHPHSTRTVFVFGFKSPTTETKLQEYFSQFGEIESFTVPRKSITKQSRGFALVKYKSEDDFENVLRQTHVLDGHNLAVEKSRPILPLREKTCFVQVRNLDSKTRKEDLQEHFSKYGSVEAIDWPTDPATNSKREFCFVQFSFPEQAGEATKNLNQSLDGMEIEVLMSNSKICTSLAATNKLNVCADSTVEAVATYFGKFGKIKSIWANYSPVGTSSLLKPMFSLIFEDESSVKEISLQTHFIEDQEVFPSRGLSKSFATKPFEKQIFIDELPHQFKASNVIQYFRQFGNVKHCRVTEDPKTGKNLNCVVTFATAEVVSKVMAEGKHQLDNKEIRVRRVGYRQVDDGSVNIINIITSTVG